jgi:hypothetical protein
MEANSWFPGRWIGGGSLILGPLLLLAGVVLRLPTFYGLAPEELAALQAEPTFFPLELAAFEALPRLIVASYGVFLAGNILMWPAIFTLATLIGRRRRGWAMWGGALAIFGLFARTFHAGVDHLAFQLVQVQNLESATQAVGDSYVAISYGPFNLVGVLGFAVFLGWVLLALGAYRSQTLGLWRSLALGLTALLFQGVLKGSTFLSVVESAGLCIALVPLGVHVLWGYPDPGSPRQDDRDPAARAAV